ncbi:hypothetical protein F4803DRAFT_434485 [Xylaria telfairii]|nr:hypothetical protein F4803DRAFT_434485 [Xylaria telfairii]
MYLVQSFLFWALNSLAFLGSTTTTTTTIGDKWEERNFESIASAGSRVSVGCFCLECHVPRARQSEIISEQRGLSVCVGMLSRLLRPQCARQWFRRTHAPLFSIFVGWCYASEPVTGRNVKSFSQHSVSRRQR